MVKPVKFNIADPMSIIKEPIAGGKNSNPILKTQPNAERI